jgi:teichuronic acid biosynthesis glycosyltransferase TuaC
MWPSEAHPVFGGFVKRNTEALRAHGAGVDVVANTDPRTGVIPSVAKYAQLARRVRRHVAGKDYDAVIGHYLYPTAGMANTAARLAGAKLVLVVHGTDSRSVRRSDPWALASRRALRSADLVIAVSHALAHTLRDDLRLPSRIPIEVIHMGIDDGVFVPDSTARSALAVGESERIVLYVGNLVHVKGLDVLQSAFERLVASGQADRLVLVGGGPLEAGLREWASDNVALRNRVLLTGRIEQAEVARWMAAADVLALPSRNEGLGLVLLEAMACGTPCVASRVGGVPEIVDGAVGALVPPDDPMALAAALARVLGRGRPAFYRACVDAAKGHGACAKAEEMLCAIESVSVALPKQSDGLTDSFGRR